MGVPWFDWLRRRARGRDDRDRRGGGEREGGAGAAAGADVGAGAGDRADIALSIVQEGRRRDVTVRELALGNKLAGDALLQVLAEKGLVDPDEVRERIRRIAQERYRPGGSDDGGEAPPRP